MGRLHGEGASGQGPGARGMNILYTCWQLRKKGRGGQENSARWPAFGGRASAQVTLWQGLAAGENLFLRRNEMD